MANELLESRSLRDSAESEAESASPVERPGLLLSENNVSRDTEGSGEKQSVAEATFPRSGQAERGAGDGSHLLLTAPSPKRSAERASGAERRTQQNREAKQRQRARQAAVGDRTITITLTAQEMSLLAELRQRQRGPIEGFERRALMMGATFAANAGNPRGKKVRGNAQAAAIAGRGA